MKYDFFNRNQWRVFDMLAGEFRGIEKYIKSDLENVLSKHDPFKPQIEVQGTPIFMRSNAGKFITKLVATKKFQDALMGKVEQALFF